MANESRQSRLISRPCLAKTTAQTILFDRPRRQRFAKWRMAHLIAVISVLLVNQPVKTAAATVESLLHSKSASGKSSQLPFEAWLDAQARISLDRMLANISPSGAKRGAVVASPSRRAPDYFFHWVRDAALVMDVVVTNYTGAANQGERLKWWRLLDDYVNFSRENQMAHALTGLGEPKFHVDGRPYMDAWGRPQNDGPALRALTLARWARVLLLEGDWNYVYGKLYGAEIPADTVIKADLEYVAHNWRAPSFDLWEEVKGDHFYTRISQLAALREGAQLARTLGDTGAADFYAREADAIENSMKGFWDASVGEIRVTLNRVEGLDYKTSGLDTAVILGVLHAGLDGARFGIDDSRVLATVERLDSAFAAIYPVNRPGRFPGAGTAIGRYPEDRYSGNSFDEGNPWVLTTAALAEVHYRLADRLESAPFLKIDSRNARFFSRLKVSARPARKSAPVSRWIPGQKLVAGSSELRAVIADLRTKGDAYMLRIREHANPDGSLSEQIDRNSGYMTSARDLTWNYAAFLTAYRARR